MPSAAPAYLWGSLFFCQQLTLQQWWPGPAPLGSQLVDGDSGKAAVAETVPRARARDPYLKPRVASASPLPCPRCARPAPAAPGRRSASAARAPRRRGGASGRTASPGAPALRSARVWNWPGTRLGIARPRLPRFFISHAERAARSSFLFYSHDFPAAESLYSHAQLKLLVSPSPRSLLTLLYRT